MAAANALATAARLSPADPDRVRRTIGAANAFWLGGQAQAAADILAGVLELTTDPLLRADMQQMRAAALVFVRPMTVTFGLLVDEARCVEPFDPERAAMMLAMATNAATAAGEVDLSIETARRAVRLLHSIDSPVGKLTALALATGLTLAGRVAEARQLLEPLIPGSRRLTL